MGLSGAAITYLVDRMIGSGHITAKSDPGDRRKVILRYSESGLATARAFFAPLGTHSHDAMADLPRRRPGRGQSGVHRVDRVPCGDIKMSSKSLEATAVLVSLRDMSVGTVENGSERAMPTDSNGMTTRKRRHIDVCLDDRVAYSGVTTGLERYRLPYNALTQTSLAHVDLSTELPRRALARRRY